MTANYHTHTVRCNHATGTEEEYIVAAIERGIKTLGFSDHTPYFFDGDYYSNFRMRPEQFGDYCECLLNLKEKYAKDVDLHIGLEAEYYPKHFLSLTSFLRDYPIEYLILGQHFVGNEPVGVYSGAPTTGESVLKQYCKLVMDAMQTGLFSCVAHPDVIHYQGSHAVYKKYLRELAREAVACGIPFEINLLGLSENRHYPCATLFEAAAEENCPMIIGIDAHNKRAIQDAETEKRARDLAKQYGCRLVDTMTLNPVNK